MITDEQELNDNTKGVSKMKTKKSKTQTMTATQRNYALERINTIMNQKKSIYEYPKQPTNEEIWKKVVTGKAKPIRNPKTLNGYSLNLKNLYHYKPCFKEIYAKIKKYRARSDKIEKYYRKLRDKIMLGNSQEQTLIELEKFEQRNF